MSALTAPQLDTFNYIVGHIEEHGCPPTVRELAEHFGISVHGARCRVMPLVKKGRIVIDGYGQSRGIRIPGVRWRMVPTPSSPEVAR